MEKTINRMGIYLIYDKEGIIDAYIPYLLKKMMPELSRLVIVCNGFVNDTGKRSLMKLTKEVYIRENRGFDAGGMKDALTKYLKWEDIWQYDELLLFNDSFFGPFDSFSHVFTDMQHREVDFWSLTKDNGYTKKVPAIQSYFIVIRKPLLQSECFRSYWEDMPYYEEFTDVLNEYEAKFAHYFEIRGYRWDAYIDMKKYDCSKDRNYAFSPYHNVQYELMKQQKYPILKKKLFALDSDTPDYGLNRKMQENFTLALEYIAKHSEYDRNLIWDNILRIYNLRNIQDCCCLRYILSCESSEEIIREKQSVVFIWITNEQSCVEYAERIRDSLKFCDVVVIAENEQIRGQISREVGSSTCRILTAKTEGRIAYLYTECLDTIRRHKYFAVLQDFDCMPTFDLPYTVEASHMWMMAENILGRGDYIRQVEKLFEVEERLGLLVTPYAVHAHYFGNLGNDWGNRYSDVKNLAGYLGAQKFIQKSRKPADWSVCFWCRSKLVPNEIESMVNEEVRLFSNDELLCMTLPYYIQEKGFYSGTVETAYFARLYESTLCIYLKGLVKSCKHRYTFSDFCQLREKEKIEELNRREIKKFLAEHKNVYVYGAGNIAEDISRYSQKYYAYVVSDGQEKPEQFHGRKVRYLSEISLHKDDGIIIALDRKHSLEVLPILEQMGYGDKILRLKM